MRYLLLIAALLAVSPVQAASCPTGYVEVETYVREGASLRLHNLDQGAFIDVDGAKCPITQVVEDDMSVVTVSCNGTEYPVIFDNGAAEFAGKIYQRKCP